MNILKNNIFLKSLIFILFFIFLFTLNLKPAKTFSPFVQIWGTSVFIYPTACPASPGFPIYYQLAPVPWIVAETIDARIRASAWFGGIYTIGQQIKANSLFMMPCLAPCPTGVCPVGPIGWVPILQGTSMPGAI